MQYFYCDIRSPDGLENEVYTRDVIIDDGVSESMEGKVWAAKCISMLEGFDKSQHTLS